MLTEQSSPLCALLFLRSCCSHSQGLPIPILSVTTLDVSHSYLSFSVQAVREKVRHSPEEFLLCFHCMNAVWNKKKRKKPSLDFFFFYSDQLLFEERHSRFQVCHTVFTSRRDVASSTLQTSFFTYIPVNLDKSNEFLGGSFLIYVYTYIYIHI